MKLLFLFFSLIISVLQAKAQSPTDTMKIGSATYIHSHPANDHGYVHARITQDSVLTVFDSLGNIVDYPVLRWTFSMTRKGTYCEVKMRGKILSMKCRKWIEEQPATGWMCIEGVVVLMPDGTERTLVGEKWVKI